MGLSDYLETPANLHAREELFNYRLLFDVKLAAAHHGYHLLTYYSDVDHDGFDIIFDDHHTVRKVQLKTVSSTKTTSSWEIHRSILRPERQNWERLGFYHPGVMHETDVGVEGGVILVEFDATDAQLPVAYYFTDIYVITAIALGHLDRLTTSIEAANNLRTDLPNGRLTDKIGVAKGLFVRAEGPSNLLSLLSMCSPHRVNWQNRVVLSGQNSKWGPKPEMLPDMLAERIAEIPDALKQACGRNNP